MSMRSNDKDERSGNGWHHSLGGAGEWRGTAGAGSTTGRGRGAVMDVDRMATTTTTTNPAAHPRGYRSISSRQHQQQQRQQQQHQGRLHHPWQPGRPLQRQQQPPDLGYHADDRTNPNLHNDRPRIHAAAAAATNGNAGQGDLAHDNVRNQIPNTHSFNNGSPYPPSQRLGQAQRPEGPGPRISQSAAQQQMATKRRRVRSVLLLAMLAFVGVLVLDGLLQFTDLSDHVQESVENAVDVMDGYERRLVHGGDEGEGRGAHRPPGLLRRLATALLDDADRVTDGAVVPPPHRSYAEEGPGVERGYDPARPVLDSDGDHDEREVIAVEQGYDPPPPVLDGDYDERETVTVQDEGYDEQDVVIVPTTTNPPRALLHTLPLLPKHALQHRQRRELIDRQLPIPEHLREGREDEMYHAHHEQRRRRMKDDNDGDVDASSDNLYETGALYQGYGTHYLDLWLGTPDPQRQTVIVDTGSSVTAFPCTGCDNCGSNPTTRERYHLDEDFDVGASATYKEKSCNSGKRNKDGKMVGRKTCELGWCAEGHRCKVEVSYAEGSSWSAVEGSDVVYPAGPHDAALGSQEQRLAEGVGAGMGSLTGDGREGKDFDWMDFRLKFGCQMKVTGLFRTQLEDGIMGMDNRKGSFWLQLNDHYKRNGYARGDASPSNGDAAASFDPAQFSLCFDRQSLSSDLRPGVGSGALTLGGTDGLLHNTPMVYAENVTPHGGWYSVRIKAMFLRTHGGTLSEPFADASAVEYHRVNADEHTLNGQQDKNKGVILDSGTTDTYLPQGLRGPFDRAWNAALGGEGVMARYHNEPEEMAPDEVRTLPTILIVLQGHAQSNPADSNAIGMASSHENLFRGSHGASSQAPVSNSDVVVAVPPSHYMEESRSHPGRYAARVYFTERYGAQSILGSNVLMGHEVNFDAGRGRMGVAESHCDYERYVREREEATTAAIARRAEERRGEGAADSERAVELGAGGDAGGQGLILTKDKGGELAASGWARG